MTVHPPHLTTPTHPSDQGVTPWRETPRSMPTAKTPRAMSRAPETEIAGVPCIHLRTRSVLVKSSGAAYASWIHPYRSPRRAMNQGRPTTTPSCPSIAALSTSGGETQASISFRQLPAREGRCVDGDEEGSGDGEGGRWGEEEKQKKQPSVLPIASNAQVLFALTTSAFRQKTEHNAEEYETQPAENSGQQRHTRWVRLTSTGA